MHKKVIKYLENNFKGDVKGKTIIITGGNAGIGFESAKTCAYLGMNVILAVRNLEKGEKAREKILEINNDALISVMKLDVSEESSIKDFVKEITNKNIDIDVFYHNAGVYRLPYEEKEGREIVVSTNFYGQVMLTSLLLPYLHSLPHDVKVVFTSSIAAKWAKINKEALLPNQKLSKQVRYANSKMLDAYLFKYLFDNDRSNVSYFLVHPGVTGTDLFNKAYGKVFAKVVNVFMKICTNPLWKSSLSIVKVLDKDAIPGSFYGPSKMLNVYGYPKDNHFLNKRYKEVEEIIHEAEKIVKYELPTIKK